VADMLNFVKNPTAKNIASIQKTMRLRPRLHWVIRELRLE